MNRLGIFATGLFWSLASTADDFSVQMKATAEQLMEQAVQGNAAYATVESLTTEIGPRLAGTQAEARARDWAVARLEALGLQNVRVETFQVQGWQRGEERAEITAPFPQSLTISTLGGSVGTGPDGIEAEIVSFASMAELESAAQSAVKGKIVFIDEPTTRTQDGSGYGTAGAKRWQAAYVAQRKGASAALIRSVGTDSDRFAHTGQMRRLDHQGEDGVPAAALSAPDADQLQRALARGLPVVVRLVLTPRAGFTVESGNVIAEIPGRVAPGEIVLAGAHLDSWDLGTGAIDDGAGVGIVTGAAQLLLEKLPRAPRRTIRLVLFGSEETGLAGARAYAQQHADELSDHILAVESDFGAGDIWRFDTGIGEAGLTAAQAIGEVLRPLGIGPGTNTARGGPDLRYMRKAGVPVVDLKQNGWDYFDLHHTANDTLDKIAPNALDQNVAAYATLLYLVADSEARFR